MMVGPLFLSLPKVDVIVVAAGSEDERRRLGRLGLKHRKALLDVGADYFRGHVQVLLHPHSDPDGCSPDFASKYDFCFLQYFQPLVPKNISQSNRIVISHHIGPLSLAKWK